MQSFKHVTEEHGGEHATDYCTTPDLPIARRNGALISTSAPEPHRLFAGCDIDLTADDAGQQHRRRARVRTRRARGSASKRGFRHSRDRTRPVSCASRAGGSRPPSTAASPLAAASRPTAPSTCGPLLGRAACGRLDKQRITAPETRTLADLSPGPRRPTVAVARERPVRDTEQPLADGRYHRRNSGPRPHVGAQLQLFQLDFPASARPARRTCEPAAAGARLPFPNRPICLQGRGRGARPGPTVRDFSGQADGQGLERRHHRPGAAGLADAELALSVDRLVYKDVKTGRAGSHWRSRTGSPSSRSRTCSSTAAARGS